MSTPPNLPSDEQESDPRVAGIVTVGWASLGALALCIPITGVLKESSALAAGLLPLAIILGAGMLAVRIWSSGEKLVNKQLNEALNSRLSELEERLANLETIDSMEEHFAQKHSNPQPAGGNTTMGPPASERTSS